MSMVLMEATPVTVDTFLENVGKLVTKGFSWMGEAWTAITSDPTLMLMTIGVGLVGLGIGLLTRVIRV